MRYLRCMAILVLTMAYGLVAYADLPKIGEPAPGFNLPDQQQRMHSLADYRGKWVVLYFYPKDDTPGCTREACAFRDDMQQLSALGSQVLGISVDDTKSHQAFADKYHLPFPLLSDTTARVAMAYGAFNDWLVMKFAKRYTFLIDPAGKIARTYLDVDTSKHSGEIIADLKQLQAHHAR